MKIQLIYSFVWLKIKISKLYSFIYNLTRRMLSTNCITKYLIFAKTMIFFFFFLNFRCSVIFNSEFFKTIIDLKNLNLPIYSKTGLIKSLVAVAICIQEKPLQKQYLEEILLPIANKYRTIMIQPNLNAIYQNEEIKLNVINVLEEMKASFSVVTVQSAEYVFGIFKEILVEIYKLLELYRNYIVSYFFF